jgi:hypothetical protein
VTIGDYASTQIEKLLEFAVLETDTLLKSASPVDLAGFALAGRCGENAAGDYDAGHSTTGHCRIQGYSQEPPDKPTPPTLRRMNYSKERPGNIYSVHNNLPYAEPYSGTGHHGGGSKQANAGWVQGIAKDVQGRVIAAAARIGRES